MISKPVLLETSVRYGFSGNNSDIYHKITNLVIAARVISANFACGRKLRYIIQISHYISESFDMLPNLPNDPDSS